MCTSTISRTFDKKEGLHRLYRQTGGPLNEFLEWGEVLVGCRSLFSRCISTSKKAQLSDLHWLWPSSRVTLLQCAQILQLLDKLT